MKQNRMAQLRIKKTSKQEKALRKGINVDGWTNVLTGLNIKSKDKKENAEIQWLRTLESDAEALLTSDDMGGKIASIIPFDGTREGITWKIDSADEDKDTVAEVTKALNSEFNRLCVWKQFSWAWTLARAYGGACAFISIDDGLPLSEPINPGAIRKIKAIHVMNRWDLDFDYTMLIDDLSDPNYGTPEVYRYNTSSGPISTSGEYIEIHHTRLIRFNGEMLPDRLFVKNGYWHDSVFGKLMAPLRNYSTSHDTIATIIQEINQPVFKIQGLTEAIAQDEDELVLDKIQIVNMVRSALRAVVLDAEDDFVNMQSTLPGAKDLVSLTKERLTAASGIPHTRLMGESPGASLGEAGRSELIDYYDMVAAQQETNLRAQINRITELIFSQIEDPISEPEEWDFKFNPLYQQDLESMIRTRNMQADIDTKYIREGVYDAVEVAKSRFGSNEFSFETQLDDDLQAERENPISPSEELDEEALMAMGSSAKVAEVPENNAEDEDNGGDDVT